jgi:hypothetical protein
MTVPETDLQMVQRHVQRGQIILARQHDLLARLKAAGQSTISAEAVLDHFVSAQELHLDHLRRLIGN